MPHTQTPPRTPVPVRRAPPDGRRRTARGRHAAAPRRSLRALLIALAALLAPSALARTSIVVSIHPYADLVRQIVGDQADVHQVLPSGASPHSFDPRPSDSMTMAGADLVVMNGGIDDWLTKLVRAAAPDVPTLVVTRALAFDPIQGDAADGTFNPHVWLDPSLMAQAVPLLADAVAGVDPEHADAYRNRAEALAAALRTLDEALAAQLAPLAGAAFVPFHDGWPYFARHYGLDLVVSIEPFAGREPSARYVSRAIADIRASGARAVFSERQLNPRPAQVVAEAAGVTLAILDPIGSDGQSYQELMRANVATVVEALSH
jgi:zinc transport system substrate-binding protein/manganese/iron transport system substrate-binding protein